MRSNVDPTEQTIIEEDVDDVDVNIVSDRSHRPIDPKLSQSHTQNDHHRLTNDIDVMEVMENEMDTEEDDHHDVMYDMNKYDSHQDKQIEILSPFEKESGGMKGVDEQGKQSKDRHGSHGDGVGQVENDVVSVEEEEEEEGEEEYNNVVTISTGGGQENVKTQNDQHEKQPKKQPFVATTRSKKTNNETFKEEEEGGGGEESRGDENADSDESTDGQEILEASSDQPKKVNGKESNVTTRPKSTNDDVSKESEEDGEEESQATENKSTFDQAGKSSQKSPKQDKMTKSEKVVVSKPNTKDSKDTVTVEPLVLQQAIEFLKEKYDSSVSLIPKILHQQYSSEENVPEHLRENMEKFKTNNPDYLYLFWGDADLELFVQKFHPFIYQVYKNLPQPILKADLARYLLLETFGGVYSDLDTVPLRPLKNWADGHDKEVALMVGIEVDTTREDWEQWYPRSLGLCQWTFAAAPAHPVLSKTIYQVLKNIKSTSNAKTGKVVEITGPAVWTDIVLEYLKTEKVVESDLRNLEAPEVFGDVYVLPITAFSPGVGHMNAKEVSDKEARVKHLFEGGWKKDKKSEKENK
jgi:alpha 1,6-mannosyltransferase